MTERSGWIGTLVDDSPRCEWWRRILESDVVPIKQGLPRMAELDEDVIGALYDLDVARLDASQRSRLIAHMVEKASISPETAEQELDSKGYGVRSDNIRINRLKWADLKFSEEMPVKVDIDFAVCNSCGARPALIGASLQSPAYPEQQLLITLCSWNCKERMDSEPNADKWLTRMMVELETDIAARNAADVAQAAPPSASEDVEWPEEIGEEQPEKL